MSLDNDRSFGKYKLVAELGSGGYGVVYQARDTTLQRTVALKLLRPQLTADPGFVQQFYHEAQLVAQLDHPNVVTVYDVGEEEGQHFIVMQYVEGRSLAEGLTRGESWPPERILPLAEQLAAALDYAHAQGVLHLDVKPGNVLLGDEDQVWLTDFGLGRAVSSATQPSSALAGGTPAYLAPEQADLEEPRPVTAAADIYGFGVLLYRLCTGRVPFEGKPTAVTTAHVNQQPPRPTLLNDALNQAVEDVLLRALAKSPQARFPDVAGLVDALAEAARKDEGRARPARVVTVEPLKLGDFRVRTLRELAQACDNAWEEAVERLCDGTLEAWLQEARLLGAAEEAKRLREAWAGAEGRERERALEEFLEWTGYVTDPVLRVTPEVLDLGEVEKGYGHRVPTVLTLQNVGRGMLWGEVMSRVAWLSVSGDPHFLIRAGERREVPVEAEVDVLPSGRTDVVEGLIVRTPVGETQVGVQVAVLGPEIHVEPPELHLGKITEGETPVRRVTVGNQGRGALQGSVRSEDPWLTVTPERFRCTAGQRTRLTVTADTKQIVEVFRELHGTITLDTNETSVAIPVRLVNPNPESVSLFLTSMISVNSVAFSPDGSILASGSDDTTVWLWDATDGMLLRTLEGHTNGVNSVAFSPDGTTLASGGNDETVRLWDVQSGQCLQTLKGHSDRVRSVTFSPDGNILASASDDRTVQLWASRSGRLLQTIKGHKGWVNSVAFCPDGNILASGSGRTVRLWDVQSGQCLQTLKGHSDRVRSVAFSPDGTTLASGSKDRTIRLWDVQNGQGLQTLESHNDRVRSVTFSPDGVTLASGADDRTVRLWDVQSGQCIQRLKGHLKGVSSVAFNLDGSILASGSEDDTVRLWDVQSSRLLQTLLGEGHTDSVSSVAFSPDSRILASGSNDTTVRLWNAADGTLLRTLEGHTDWVLSVAFSPDGSILASISLDGPVRLWRVDIVPPSSATEDTDDFPEKRVRIALIAVSILIVVAAGIAIQDGAGAAQFLGLLLLVVGVTIFTWAVLGWFILRRR